MTGMSASRRAFAAWLAAFAVLCGALVPALSSMLAFYGIADGEWLIGGARTGTTLLASSDTALICHALTTAEESRVDDRGATFRVSVTGFASDADHNGQGNPVDHHGAFHLSHCPYCVTHAGSVGLLPGTWSLGLPQPSGFLLPPLFLLARYPLFAWLAPPSRAPPSSC